MATIENVFAVIEGAEEPDRLTDSLRCCIISYQLFFLKLLFCFVTEASIVLQVVVVYASCLRISKFRVDHS
jgi:hypothetical protein